MALNNQELLICPETKPNHSNCFVKVLVAQPYNNTDTDKLGKKSHTILSEISDFLMVNNLLRAVHTVLMLTLLSVDGILLPGYRNCSTYH